MAFARLLRVGPVALTIALGTNILNPATAGAGVGYTPTATFLVLRRLRVVNKTNAPINVSLWIGASGANVAGTEFTWSATPVPAAGFLEAVGLTRLDATDFLVGGASALGLTLTIDVIEGLA